MFKLEGQPLLPQSRGLGGALGSIPDDTVVVFQPREAIRVTVTGVVDGLQGVPQPQDQIRSSLAQTHEASPEGVEYYVLQRDAVPGQVHRGHGLQIDLDVR